MKSMFAPALVAALLTVSACGGQGDDSLGDQAAEAGEAQAENLEAMAENSTGPGAERLEEQAEAAEERGEAREEAIDESDVEAGELSAEQRNTLVNGQ